MAGFIRVKKRYRETPFEERIAHERVGPFECKSEHCVPVPTERMKRMERNFTFR
jgi:hypothetical protein